MCNRYSTPEIAEVERFWHIGRSNPLNWTRDLPGFSKPWKPVIGPRGDGPFFRAGGEFVVGQWGVIPDGSPTRVAKDPRGKPLATNNTRREKLRIRSSMWHPIWQRGQRCLIPAPSYDEPYYPQGLAGKSVWWRFRRADGLPWGLAGVWNDWVDPDSGEVVSSYSMLTMNCDAHPLLRLMHKPEVDRKTGEILPPAKQDKRTVVPVEPEDWDTWLHGDIPAAEALIELPSVEVFAHGPADPTNTTVLEM